MAAKRPEPPDDRRGSNQPKSRASWRKGPTTVAANQPAWSSSQWSKIDPAVHRGTLQRRFKLAALLVLLALFSAGYAYHLKNQLYKVPLAVVVLHDYQSALTPPNSWASEDAKRFEDAPGNLAVGITNLDDLGTQLKKQPPGGPGNDVTIIYLSGQGVVNESGEPCLIDPASLEPLNSQKWMRLDDLLKRICAAQPGTETKKLVLLDCGRIDSDWSLGVLKNDFSARVAETVRRIELPELTVICSAGPGQRSYAAPELGGSVFGYFAARGFHGEADEVGDGNGKVSLRELEAFLHANVGRWVTEHRAGLQRPQLLNVADKPVDYPISFAETKAFPAPEKFTLAADSRWDEVAGLWVQHDELKREHAYRHSPLLFATLDAKLVRMEQFLLAGPAYDEAFKSVRDKAKELIGTLAKPTGQLPGLTLVLWRTLPEFSAAQESAQALLKVWPPKPDKEFKPDEFSFESRVLAGFNYLQQEPSWTRLGEALTLIDGGKPQEDGKPVPIELHYARMLKQFLDQGATDADLKEALALRNDAEKAAWPVDPRVQYWTKQLILTADRDRRQAEDLLFVGGREERQKAGVIWLNAVSKEGATYRAASALADELTAAYQVRDQSLAEAPYYAQWLLADHTLSADEMQSAQNYISVVQKLSELLEEPLQEETSENRLTAILEAHTAARTIAKQLTDRLEKEKSDLASKRGADQEQLRDLERLLATPLVTGEPRAYLRRIYLELLTRSASNPVATSAVATKPPVVDDDVTQPQLEHPAFGLLRSASATPKSDEKGAEKKRSWAAQGGALRARLGELPALAESLSQETTNQLGLAARDGKEDEFTIRGGYGRADRLLRAAAGVCGDWPEHGEQLQNDRFSRQLAALDTHNLLLFQTSRILEDFWGAGGAVGPYFANAAQLCLNAAKNTVKTILPKNAGFAERDQLASKLQSLSEAAEKLALQDPKPLDPSQSGQMEIYFPPQLPQGTAAAFLRAKSTVPALFNEETEPRRRCAVDIDTQSPTKSLTFKLKPEEPQLPEQLNAVAIFRGHVREKPLLIDNRRGLQIAYTPAQYPPPKITVRGNLQENSAILFIFDCSGSMTARTEIRSTEFTGNSKPAGERRMDAAKKTLNDILKSIATDQFRVGLMVYGHRAGWLPVVKNGRKDYVRDYSTYAKKMGQNDARILQLHPLEDVELERPIRRFGPEQLKDWQALLSQLEPKGETPLYLSLQRALTELQAIDDTVKKQIVVITDGANNQDDDPNPPPTVRENKVTATQIKTFIAQNRHVRIDIVGFGKEFSNPRDNLHRELKQIVAPTLGNLYSAQTREDLLEKLRESLGLQRYVVETADNRGRLKAVDGMELEQTWELNRPGEYFVRLVDFQPPVTTSCKLEGGEAVRIFVRRSAERGNLEFDYGDYDRNDFPTQGYVSTLSASGQEAQPQVKVGIHVPEKLLDQWVFRISLQNTNSKQFSARPAESWTEIQPLNASEQPIGEPYVFFDQKFEVGQPVPVLMCSCPAWPEEAEKAAVQLWCKFGSRSKGTSIKIETLQKQARKSVEDQDFSILNTESAAGVVRLSILQQPKTADSQLYKVELARARESETDSPATQIIHEYFGAAGRVKHEFIIDDNLASELSDFRLIVTPKSALVDGSLHMPKPRIRPLRR
jgi:hypothetical protein